jgi:hypothetical protein
MHLDVLLKPPAKKLTKLMLKTVIGQSFSFTLFLNGKRFHESIKAAWEAADEKRTAI